MIKDIWLAIDTKTNRLIDFGGQSAAKLSANQHEQLSGNKTVLRTLKIGMVILERD